MKKIPIVELDMQLAPSERFLHIPKKYLRAGKTLAQRSNAEIGHWALQRLAATVLDTTTAFRNPYRQEMAAWAGVLGISRSESLTANFAYELSQMASWGYGVYDQLRPRLERLHGKVSAWYEKAIMELTTIRDSHLACTAGAAYYPKLGNVLVRSMDWSLEGLGTHSVLWKHTGLDVGDYYSLGWPGYVGVLSGNAPGRFAATINLAPPVSPPFVKGWPPSHLLRRVFDTCEDYEDALEALEFSEVCFPAFVMLVGTKPGQAAIVELTPEENRIHAMRARKPIAIGNDYLSAAWRERFGATAKDVEPHEKGSREEHRRNAMLRELNRRKPQTLAGAFKAVQADWIWNDATVQQMIFMPGSGECIVYGLEDTEPVAAGGVKV